MTGLFSAILLAVSLCADCFAVSLCSSVTLKSVRASGVQRVACAFAVIQTLLLFFGWLFGSALAGLVFRIAHIIGFLLLLYVGGSMLVEGIRWKDEARNLNGWKNIIVGGIATSIDALAVGVSQSICGQSFRSCLPLLASVFIVTWISVCCGIYGGRTIGRHFGRIAEIVGGMVLIGIGLLILLK